MPRSAFAITLAVACIVAGCSSYNPQSTAPRYSAAEEKKAYPANYRPEILAFLRTFLNDPTNIRNAAIAEPVFRAVGAEERYVVCLRFNARRGSGYAGLRENQMVFIRGRFERMTEARQGECKGAKYQPFPELERLTR